MNPDKSLYPVSFLCPNGTIFNQEVFTCDWWFNVDCGAAAAQALLSHIDNLADCGAKH